MKLPAAILIAFTAGSLAAGAVRAADKPATPAPAKPSASAPGKGFDAFRLVKARNIFDPDRRGMPSASAPRSSGPPRANFIKLTGTMVAEGKTLAFFSGSRSEYSKVISVGDSIADFKITGITNARVELDRGGKHIPVDVGSQVPLEGSSAATAAPDPSLTDTPAQPADSPSPGDASPASISSESKPAGPPGGEQNEVLRRMMERRAKEMSK